MPLSWTTWENKNSLLEDYPNVLAWGQVGKRDGGNVTHLGEPRTLATASTDNMKEGLAEPGGTTLAVSSEQGTGASI